MIDDVVTGIVAAGAAVSSTGGRAVLTTESSGAVVTGAEVTGAEVIGAVITGEDVTGAEEIGAFVTGEGVIGDLVTGIVATGAAVSSTGDRVGPDIAVGVPVTSLVSLPHLSTLMNSTFISLDPPTSE